MRDYKQDLLNRFWNSQKNNFKDKLSLFDPPEAHYDGSPPVFHIDAASNNVLLKQGLPKKIKKEVLNQIPKHQRHKWFRSMSSSQALTQSVFGNLKVFKKLDCLAKLNGEDGKPLFLRGSNFQEYFSLEFVVDYLGEPRPTNVDVFFGGDYRVAVECKFTEPEVGTCSRPKIKSNDSNYNQDYCDGRYVAQRGRSGRCSLSSRGIKYWQYIPRLFNWPADIDHEPCPLRETYQLVRNVLSACVRSDGVLDPENGHAVLLYDKRNPAFQPGGKGWTAWQNVREALRDPSLLQVCTWQQVVDVMRLDLELFWLTDSLQQKYGL